MFLHVLFALCEALDAREYRLMRGQDSGLNLTVSWQKSLYSRGMATFPLTLSSSTPIMQLYSWARIQLANRILYVFPAYQRIDDLEMSTADLSFKQSDWKQRLHVTVVKMQTASSELKYAK